MSLKMQVLDTAADFEEAAREGYDAIFDFIDNVVEVHYVTNDKDRTVGMLITDTIGGPTIVIDTVWQEARGYWAGERYTVDLTDEACTEFNEALNIY